MPPSLQEPDSEPPAEGSDAQVAEISLKLTYLSGSPIPGGALLVNPHHTVLQFKVVVEKALDVDPWSRVDLIYGGQLGRPLGHFFLFLS